MKSRTASLWRILLRSYAQVWLVLTLGVLLFVPLAMTLFSILGNRERAALYAVLCLFPCLAATHWTFYRRDFTLYRWRSEFKHFTRVVHIARFLALVRAISISSPQLPRLASIAQLTLALATFGLAFISLLAIRPEAYATIAQTSASASDYPSAIAFYSRAIELNPTSPHFYSARGDAYAAQGDFSRAFIDYNQAIKFNPAFSDAYVSRADALIAVGDYERAILDYDRAIDLNPNLAAAYLGRGNAISALAYYDQAIADYSQAISIYPAYSVAYSDRANAFAELNQLDRAILDYGRALLLDPNDVTSYLSRGLIYAQLGQQTRAIDDLEKALLLSSDPDLQERILEYLEILSTINN